MEAPETKRDLIINKQARQGALQRSVEGNEFPAPVIHEPRWSRCDHKRGSDCHQGIG